uniref:FLYWCH-type domain-containing protein n=1 Tax=Timema cristinae TaxID=61476 RepID=A0A7R9CER6_TIMCR|nr:unnamed protein product [Timema cristinae]
MSRRVIRGVEWGQEGWGQEWKGKTNRQSESEGGILPPQGTVVERDRKKCIYYSLYAWGSTILISVISLIMEFTPGIPDTFLKPEFGKKTCWFETGAIIILMIVAGDYLPLSPSGPRPDHAGKMRARTPSLEGRASQIHVLSPAIANPGGWSAGALQLGHTSERGKKIACHRKYLTNLQWLRLLATYGKVRWRCANKKCSAKVYTDNIYSTVIIDGDTNHNHEVVKNIDRHVISNGVKRRAKENLCERPSKLIRSELANYHAEDITTHNIALVRNNIYVARRDAVPKLPTNKEEVLKRLFQGAVNHHDINWSARGAYASTLGSSLVFHSQTRLWHSRTRLVLRVRRSPIFFFFSGYFLPWPVDIPIVLDSSSPASRLFPSEQSSSSKEELPTLVTSHLDLMFLLLIRLPRLHSPLLPQLFLHQLFISVCFVSSLGSVFVFLIKFVHMSDPFCFRYPNRFLIEVAPPVHIPQCMLGYPPILEGNSCIQLLYDLLDVILRFLTGLYLGEHRTGPPTDLLIIVPVDILFGHRYLLDCFPVLHEVCTYCLWTKFTADTCTEMTPGRRDFVQFILNNF